MLNNISNQAKLNKRVNVPIATGPRPPCYGGGKPMVSRLPETVKPGHRCVMIGNNKAFSI